MVNGGDMNDMFKNLDEDKQSRIIKVAMAEFAEHGYKGASTNRLVKKLGISKGSLFKYFDSKYVLYCDLVYLATKDLLDHMNQLSLDGSKTVVDQILSYGEWEYTFLIEKPLYYKFFFAFQIDLDLPELVELRENITKQGEDVFLSLMKQVGLSHNRQVVNHLALLITAYNRNFLRIFKEEECWDVLKDDYLKGLKMHLNFVDWSVV